MPFLDTYLPAKIPGYPCASSPRFKTSIQTSAGGGEQRNQEWEHPLHRFTLPQAVRKWDMVNALAHMWRITRGPWRSFAWRDPHDFASRDLEKPNLVPAIGPLDQEIGIGDGFTDSFALVKTYQYSGEEYDRPLHLPVLASVVVAIDGETVDAADYTVSRPGGVVQFADPPLDGAVITAGFLFDCEVRFEADDLFEQVLLAMHLSSSADLTLIEVRPC